MRLPDSFRFVLLFWLIMMATLVAEDWGRFRGPQGSGICHDPQPIPTQWNDADHLRWKVRLPGPGGSSPIVVGEHVFVTCWSGYATGGATLGQIENLQRHLVCLDRTTGQQRWCRTVPARLPEDSFRGLFTENGYATHTPVSDGSIVVAFFGKSGVHAYDMQGNPLWQVNVGERRDHRGWGTSASPLLYKHLVIVPATIESNALVALHRDTGDVVWRQQAGGFANTWGTPILIHQGGRAELVLAVPAEIWALNPDTGKLRWYCQSINTQSMCSSIAFDQGVLYAIESGPGGGGAIAVKAGGEGDVTDTHVLWRTTERSRICTPIICDEKLYYFTAGIANCLNARTGDKIYSQRLRSRPTTVFSTPENSAPYLSNRPSSTLEGPSRLGRGQDYSSPILADNKLIYVRRGGEVHVIQLGGKFEQLAVNHLDSAHGDFRATPAASSGKLFFRSSTHLYCIGHSAP
ncbi:MAG: serine/threonine protein kinase [Blastopirellula sp.]|nr:serine/threonine protein kinase [Blastopirellula sp.]